MYLFTLALTRVNVIQKYAGLMLHNKEKKLKNEKYERKQFMCTCLNQTYFFPEEAKMENLR